MNTFVVVEFTLEGTVAVVHVTWLTDTVVHNGVSIILNIMITLLSSCFDGFKKKVCFILFSVFGPPPNQALIAIFLMKL